MRVVIHGAGAFGLATGFACARRGALVHVVDPAGVGAGASGGPVGALAPHVPENWNEKKAFQFDSLISAGAFWGDVARIGGAGTGYGRLGRLQPLEDDAAIARAEARADEAHDLWQGLAVWDVIRAEDAGPFAPVTPTGWLVRDTLSARIDPPRACAALAAAILRRGGRISATLPDRADGADAVIWATGAEGLAALGQALGREVGTGVKGQGARLACDRRGAPQVFADGLHIVPHDDGTTAVGSTTERVFADPQATDGQLDTVIARACAAVPALAGAEVIARWAGVRPRARSRAPMLGPYPDRPGHYVVNGGFKIGWGMAPKVADVMADLVLEGRDAIPPGFRVDDNL